MHSSRFVGIVAIKRNTACLLYSRSPLLFGDSPKSPKIREKMCVVKVSAQSVELEPKNVFSCPLKKPFGCCSYANESGSSETRWIPSSWPAKRAHRVTHWVRSSLKPEKRRPKMWHWHWIYQQSSDSGSIIVVPIIIQKSKTVNSGSTLIHPLDLSHLGANKSATNRWSPTCPAWLGWRSAILPSANQHAANSPKIARKMGKQNWQVHPMNLKKDGPSCSSHKCISYLVACIFPSWSLERSPAATCVVNAVFLLCS